jgi:hypothetical protein
MWHDLKGSGFKSVEETEKVMTAVLNRLRQLFLGMFRQMKRTLELATAAGGSNFKITAVHNII